MTKHRSISKSSWKLWYKKWASQIQLMILTRLSICL